VRCGKTTSAQIVLRAGNSNGQSQSSLKAIEATKAAKAAYDEVKIAIAAAGHLAPSSRQTM